MERCKKGKKEKGKKGKLKSFLFSFHFSIFPFFLVYTFPFFLPYTFSDSQWPLKEETYLTGSFGEFRKNHIHAGIDISTHGRIGLPVYAGESGLLYRVKRQVLGFGKAVYIRLENGNYLVYAHLDRFNPEIENILEKEEGYQVDISIKEKIPINKGDLIGYTGDTGGVAPHLHMEIRDTDERPINPLSIFNMADTTKPIISGVAICDPYTTKSSPFTTNIQGKAGLAVSVYDPSHGNKLGVYKIDLIVNGKLHFTVKLDTFSYDEFKNNFLLCNKDLYVNPVRSRPAKGTATAALGRPASNGVNHNKIYYHLFRAFGNKLPFYPLDSDGILDLSPGKHSVVIDAYDYAGNKSSLQLSIVSKPQASPQKPESKTNSWYSKDKLCKVTIDQYYPIQVEIDKISPNVYNIKPKEAVFKKATISIAGDGHIYRYEDKKWKYMGKDTITVTDLGKFAVLKDTTPPNIRIISTYPVFRAKIDDSGSGLDYDKLSLYIDGKKVIAEYSANKKELFYTMPKGKHRIECVASDKVDNIAKRLL